MVVKVMNVAVKISLTKNSMLLLFDPLAILPMKYRACSGLASNQTEPNFEEQCCLNGASCLFFDVKILHSFSYFMQKIAHIYSTVSFINDRKK